MRIEKVLNNNVAVVLNEQGLETVVMGRGLAFQKRPGDTIDTAAIEKVFNLAGKDTNVRFQELLTQVPMEIILLSETIISQARQQLAKRLSDSIYITLTDHIANAVDRFREGILLRNALLWDIRQFYPEEFQMGLAAVELVNQGCGTDLGEDEAAFMALHFVNAQLDEDMTLVHDMTKLIQEITSIVKYHFQIEYRPGSLAYYRFINHLKYFSQRLFRREHKEDDIDDLMGTIRLQQSEAFECAEKIADFIDNQYQYRLGNDEMLFMTVHIARIVKEARKQTNQ